MYSICEDIFLIVMCRYAHTGQPQPSNPFNYLFFPVENNNIRFAIENMNSQWEVKFGFLMFHINLKITFKCEINYEIRVQDSRDLTTIIHTKSCGILIILKCHQSAFLTKHSFRSHVTWPYTMY